MTRLRNENPISRNGGLRVGPLIYRKNPLNSALPKDVPQDLDTHMFGPETLLREQLGEKQKDLWQS